MLYKLLVLDIQTCQVSRYKRSSHSYIVHVGAVNGIIRGAIHRAGSKLPFKSTKIRLWMDTRSRGSNVIKTDDGWLNCSRIAWVHFCIFVSRDSWTSSTRCPRLYDRWPLLRDSPTAITRDNNAEIDDSSVRYDKIHPSRCMRSGWIDYVSRFIGRSKLTNSALTFYNKIDSFGKKGKWIFPEKFPQDDVLDSHIRTSYSKLLNSGKLFTKL